MSASCEVQDLTSTLDRHRGFLLQTANGLTEEQWMEFAARGSDASTQVYGEDIDWSQVDGDAPDPRLVLTAAETLPALRERVLAVGAPTTELLETLDLDAAHALPAAPWFEPGAEWSVRRVSVHMIAEISQHAGHADIIREAVDGARTMG